jgi:hypothetical protein
MRLREEEWGSITCRRAYRQGYLAAMDDMRLVVGNCHYSVERAHEYLWCHLDNKL